MSIIRFTNNSRYTAYIQLRVSSIVFYDIAIKGSSTKDYYVDASPGIYSAIVHDPHNTGYCFTIRNTIEVYQREVTGVSIMACN